MENNKDESISTKNALEEKSNETKDETSKRKHDPAEEESAVSTKVSKSEPLEDKGNAEVKEFKETTKSNGVKPEVEITESTKIQKESNTEPCISTGGKVEEKELKVNKDVDENEGHVAVETGKKESAAKPAASVSPFSQFASFSNASSPFSNVSTASSEPKEEKSAFGAFASSKSAFTMKSVKDSPFKKFAAGTAVETESGSGKEKENDKKSSENFDELLANTSAKAFENQKGSAGETKSEPKEADKGSGDSTKSTMHQLSDSEIITGEEEEESIFSVRARLYVVADEKKTWKERGQGILKVNVPKQRGSGSGRLLMRNDAVHRVIMNVPLFQGMSKKSLQIASASSGGSANYLKIFVIENGKSVLYAVRVKDNSLAEQLRNHVLEAIPKGGREDA